MIIVYFELDRGKQHRKWSPNERRRREDELTGRELIGEEEERRRRDVDRRGDPEPLRDFWKQNDKKINLFFFLVLNVKIENWLSLLRDYTGRLGVWFI